MRSLLLACCALFLISNVGFAEVETWTNVTGQTMEAEFVKMDGADVVFRKDGKEVPVPLTRLSVNDRARVIALAAGGGGADPFGSTKKTESSGSKEPTGSNSRDPDHVLV